MAYIASGRTKPGDADWAAAHALAATSGAPLSIGPPHGVGRVVEQIDEEKQRLDVSVSVFGRATPLELDYGQVETLVLLQRSRY
jgi:hypothetical protein